MPGSSSISKTRAETFIATTEDIHQSPGHKNAFFLKAAGAGLLRCRPGLVNPGEHNAKGSALIQQGLVLQSPAVLFHDARRNRQPQAGAGLLGGEEWIEKALLDIRRNPLPGVCNLEDHS